MPQRATAVVSRLATLERELQRLSGDLNRLVAVLDEILALLSITRRVADLMTRLYELLEEAYYGLSALVGIPIVGQVAEALQEVVGTIKNHVQPYKEQIEHLEDSLAPLRKQVEPARDRLGELRAPVEELKAFVTRERGWLSTTNDTVDALPESRYGRCQAVSLDDLANGLGGIVDACLAKTRRARPELEQVFGSLAGVEAACAGLGDSARTIDELIGQVGDVQDDASTVEDVLNTPIGFAGAETTIGDVLRMVSIIPEEVLDEIMSELRGPLGALESNLGLELPDLPALVSGFRKVLTDLQASKSRIDEATPELAALARDDDVQRAFAAVAP